MTTKRPMIFQESKWIREMHCCGPLHEDERLSIKISDGGGGAYLVVNAFEWSLESDADINELCAFLKNTMVTAQEQQQKEQACDEEGYAGAER